MVMLRYNHCDKTRSGFTGAAQPKSRELHARRTKAEDECCAAKKESRLINGL